jgi:hypothetical protein
VMKFVFSLFKMIGSKYIDYADSLFTDCSQCATFRGMI